ncbi:SPFH domain-containing protein [Kitasatospora sp. NPDC057223]|uniref:SPFH domain-containing protein n=1 Tax=Kitasatospora sp. NPDC057223 TaxID=3346055 RepID=UPI00363CA11F
MDVTRDSSQRPDNQANALPRALAELPTAGSSPLPKAAKPAIDTPTRRSALRTVADPLEGGPVTEPTAVRPAPPVNAVQAPSADRPSPRGRTVKAAPHDEDAAVPATTSRRPPRIDPVLREHSAIALPGWIGLLALLTGLATVLVVLSRAGVIPYWSVLPDIRTDVARASGSPDVTVRSVAAVSAGGLLILFTLAGLLANAGGETRVLTRWGRYRGTVRRTGLVWVNPLLRRRRVDVRLRHWRSEPVNAVDRTGTPIVVRLLIVWRVKDTARALLSIADHEDYLREQVHAVLTRTASALPCDSNAGPGPALRDGQWFADELTRALAAEVAPAGLEVYSVQPMALDYAPEVADSMRRRRLADLDAGLRTVLVDDAVEAAALAVRRLERATAHELDEAARSALMEHLLVAFVAPAGVAASVPSPGVRAGGPSPAVRAGRKEGRPA